jgi:hypothetical protein
LGIASPVLADPDPPHSVDPLPPPPPTASKTFAPPPTNLSLPVVTVSTMPVPIYARDPDTDPRTAVWIATGVVATFAIATEAWWLYRNKFEQHGLSWFQDPKCNVLTGLSDPDCSDDTLARQATHDHNEHVWNYTELGLAAGMGVSGFIAGYLWSRHFHSLHQVGFAAASSGASVSLGGSF